MTVLFNNSEVDISIATKQTIGSYTAPSDFSVLPLIIIQNASGSGGTYTPSLSIDGVVLEPERSIPIYGRTAFRLNGRPLFLRKDETLTVALTGLSDDNNVSVSIILWDTTIANTDEVAAQLQTPIEDIIKAYLPTVNITVERPPRTLLSVIPRTPVNPPNVLN